MVVNQEGVGEHKNGLGDVQSVFEILPGRFWLKMLDCVVANVANGSSSEGSYFRYLDIFVDRELSLESSYWIAFDLLIGTDPNNPEWVYKGWSQTRFGP